MNCGHGANELHGLCFYEARILLVPASSFQKEPTDPHAILKMKRRKKSSLNFVRVIFNVVFAKLWISASGKLRLPVRGNHQNYHSTQNK